MSQLAAMKLIVNRAYENMGLQSTQLLGSVMDSMLRKTPEALEFIPIAEERMNQRCGCSSARSLSAGFAFITAGSRPDKRAGQRTLHALALVV